MYLGDFTPGDTVAIDLVTVDSTGAPVTFSGTPAVKVYKDGSTAEVTTGVTLSVDYDSRTGLNRILIDTSSDATFYAAAKDYRVVVTQGTAGGISIVGYVVGRFSLLNRSHRQEVVTPPTVTQSMDFGDGEKSQNVPLL